MHCAVIGCGIAGPAAALFVKQLGAEVTVFDKVSDLCPVGAGFLLQPAGLDVLNQLGLAQTLMSQGSIIHGLHGVNHRGKVVLELRYQDLVAHHVGLGVHRAVVYQELLHKMQQVGVEIINPCTITEIKQNDKQVILQDTEYQEYGPYDCVIIADGVRSQLRSSVTHQIQVKPYEWGALWAIGSDRDGLFSNVLEQVYHGTAMMAGMLPMGSENGRLNISFFWSLKQSLMHEWMNKPLAQWKNQVTTLWPELAGFLEQFPTHDDFALANYADVRVFPWHNQRVVIIGDAAHGMSPQLGQGANLGLLDAKVLFECLKQHDVPEALALYTQRRKAQIRYYQQASRFVTPWFQSSSCFMGMIRDLFHGGLCKTPIIKRQMLLTLACMKTSYFTATSLDSFSKIKF